MKSIFVHRMTRRRSVTILLLIIVIALMASVYRNAAAPLTVKVDSQAPPLYSEKSS